jgi:outer membrane protein OmpA-like peptidoglycan-associated protein
MLAILCLGVGVGATFAQQNTADTDVIRKSTNAVGYQVGGGATKVDLKGTSLASRTSGEAEVKAEKGITNIKVKVLGLPESTKLGAEFLTYVLWVVSPDGRTDNIGELQRNKNGGAELAATSQLQTFSLIVTAEPYFAVRQPSELVVLENAIRKNTKGRIFVVDKYELMRRGLYDKVGNPLSLTVDLKGVPLEMYEARNAVSIAKSRGADQYAGDIFAKAEASLKQAETALDRKANKKEIVSTARQSVQFAEDARALSIQRQVEEQIAREKADAAARAKADAEAKAAAEAAEARRKADEEARRQAEVVAAREAQMKAEAESAALKAKMEQDAAKAQADRARLEAARAEREKQALRASLLAQFNRVLATQDTPRGLVVTMGDVLFDTGKYNLRSEARERLARLSGIVLAHPGLNLEVEGHTDSVGGDELNQKLSEQRAETTRDYLIEQGLPDDNVTASGYGKNMPVADNGTAEGRQQNRRVEIIISGEVIGARIGR